MPYFNPTPSQSTTLTAAERASEARRLLTLLREVEEEEFTRRLTPQAQEFISSKLLEMDLGGQLNVSVSQLHWLRDLKSKFD